MRLILFLALLLSATLVPPVAAQPSDAPQIAAAAWLADQYDAGEVTSPGALSDLIFALAGTDQQDDTLAAARADLEAAAADVDPISDNPGALGKGLLGIRVAGGDGADLEAALRDLITDGGPDDGQIGTAGAFLQALAVMGLTTTTDGAPPATVQWLASRRCPDGGFEFGADVCTTAAGGDVDTTALVIQALVGQSDVEDALDGAVDWLLDQQAGDGSFSSFGTPNSNSTGLAGQALRAAGRLAAADRAAAFNATLQKPDGDGNAGALAFSSADDGSLFLATAQGVLAFGAPAFPAITPGIDQRDPRGRACVGDEGVTVIVDLSLFDDSALEGDVMIGCAAGDPSSSIDALREADFEVEIQSFDFGDLVCAIEGRPELACDEPFTGDFWAFFTGNDDGSWATSMVGASDRDPDPGDIDGWRYGDGAEPSVPALPATPTGAACDGDEGVTVVVDLTLFDEGIVTSCAVGDPVNGLDALRLANFDIVTQASDFGEFVCAIEGRPELACDEPFAGNYWAYFEGSPDGSFTEYQVGASDTDPQPGDIEGWRYGDGAAPGAGGGTDTSTDTPTDTLRRLAGDDRISTAIAISQDRFADGMAGAVVLGRADVFADALPGTPLAVAVDGPILITPTDTVDERVRDEIARVLPDGGTVYLLGGEVAISADVEEALADLGYDVVRAGGRDRIETALAVAEAIGLPTNLLITTGYNFPDALSAGAAAAATGDGAVLLTGDGEPHPAVDAYLDSRTDTNTDPGTDTGTDTSSDTAVFSIGGPASAAYPAATSVMGDTREETAVAVAETFFNTPTVVGVARNDEFADALAGGYHIATLGGPLLLTSGEELSAASQVYVCATPSTGAAVVYGGEAAIAPAVAGELADALDGGSCN
ncbi:cell wall-binding repeat-containing protein [Euzebya tangerina]|uniref:cell wall-binding repeat-containing protein n=1 Tax=Euzebya tangerina TaxID=591198 RepID=UPI000E3212E3|nr:cell wall-binding repeat-containing protein [Euzebya tangerina]